MASWPRVKEVLALALEAAPDQRAALLDAHCAGDAELRAEVESLLAAEADAGLFIATPAVDASTEDDEHDPHIGSTIGAYVIDRCLGRGGMGAVYLGHHTGDFSHSVAIKMIRRGMDSELVVRRFRHERQMLASLNHPHIARLFDGGTTAEGLPYFVMEYIAGAPIDRYADERRLNVGDRMRLCLAVFDAVQHAHDRQIIHRDLKPGNVLVTADGEVKLLDFGISKWLGAGTDGDSTMTSLARPMTPEYASPEQIRGGTITPATDVYALGLLMYELLTGHRPFRFNERTPEEISNVVCEQEPERPSTAIRRVETTTRADGTTDIEDADHRQRNARRIAGGPAQPLERAARRHRDEGAAQGARGTVSDGGRAGRRCAALAGRAAGVGGSRCVALSGVAAAAPAWLSDRHRGGGDNRNRHHRGDCEPLGNAGPGYGDD